jgi:hypothetical protein
LLALGLLAAAGFIGLALRGSPQFEQKAYGVGLLVAALVCAGFALVWGDAQWLVIALAGVAICCVLQVAAGDAGFVLVALGWRLHPAGDLGLHLYGQGEHIVPHWYAVACVAFDLTVAGAIAYRLSVWTRQSARGSILGA